LRDGYKGKAWTERGCEVALATIEDAASLAAAFRGAEAVFVLVPPNLDPQPGFPEARTIGKALRSALEAARPARVNYANAFKAHVDVGFFRGAELADPDGLLEGTGKFMRHVKLRPGQPVEDAAFEEAHPRRIH
jgi:uncharacterized protein YbjT (DUF2867 family)